MERDSNGGAAGEPVAPPHETDGAEGGAQDDIQPLQTQVQELTERTDRLLANWQRAQADLANYRRQVEREREELVNAANAALARDLLLVLDDLERAMTSVAEQLRGFTWVDGIWLIEKKLQAIMGAHGLEEIKAEGEPFDPHVHQSVAEAEGQAGKVVAVVQRGYTLRGRLIRPALVTVGRQGNEEPSNQETAPDQPEEAQEKPPQEEG